MTSEHAPAFPAHDYIVSNLSEDGFQKLGNTRGFDAREQACIELRVAESGTPWLDELIRKARRMELAGEALKGHDIDAYIDHGRNAYPDGGVKVNWAGMAQDCLAIADALLAEEEKSQAAPSDE